VVISRPNITVLLLPNGFVPRASTSFPSFQRGNYHPHPSDLSPVTATTHEKGKVHSREILERRCANCDHQGTEECAGHHTREFPVVVFLEIELVDLAPTEESGPDYNEYVCFFVSRLAS